MPSNHAPPSDLSERQRAVLQSAVREGYFKVPREVSTIELAEEYGMSSREASAEINRGLDIILGNADLIA